MKIMLANSKANMILIALFTETMMCPQLPGTFTAMCCLPYSVRKNRHLPLPV